MTSDQQTALPSSSAVIAGIISLSAKAGFLHQIGCHHLVVLQECRCVHGLQFAICHNHPAIDDCIGGFAGAAKYQSGERIPGGTGKINAAAIKGNNICCLLYTSPSPRDGLLSRMPSSA